MPVYMYTARNQDGKTIQGQQEAVSEVAAINILQGSNLFVTQIVNTTLTIKAKQKIQRKRHRRIKSEDPLFLSGKRPTSWRWAFLLSAPWR